MSANTKLPAGHNPMLPLSEFTVTFVDHTKPKAQEHWADWIERTGTVFTLDYTGAKIKIKAPKPTDVEVYLGEDAILGGWEIVWGEGV